LNRPLLSRFAIRRVTLPLALVCLGGGGACAAELHTNDFQAGLAGWNSGGSTVSLEPSGGPAGADDAFMQVASTGSRLATRNSSAAWTGDFVAIGATQITADLMAPASSAPLNIRLVLFGPGPFLQVAPRWTSTEAVMVPADGQWRHYTFSLAEEDLTQVVAGSGNQDYNELISGISQVMLRHNTGGPMAGGTNVVGTLAVDNVTLAAADPPLLPGDYNDDGRVDLADYTRWRDALGAAPGTLANDPVGGVIGVDHYTTWKANFGAAAPAIAADAIPEPSTGGLLAIAFPMALAGTRRLLHLAHYRACSSYYGEV